MSKNSYVEICVSDFEQSVQWFENVLGFRAVVLEENEYAELRRGETSIQLAADSAPYWESEHARLLPSGQRGSGVEIVLVVDDVNAIYRQAQQAHAEIVRELADYPWHMRQFWVRHPDGYLIRPAQRLLAVDPSTYRRQIVSAFREDEEPIAQKLLAVKDAADGFARQQDYLSAATVYEMIVKEIFEQAHLYYDEDEEYDDYYEEEYGHPEEEGLKELVQECIDALGACLVQEQTDRVAREKTIQVLFDIYRHDIKADKVGFAGRAAKILVQHTTSLERHTIADRIRAALAGEAGELVDDEEEFDKGERLGALARHEYGGFLLDLESDTLDDEAYLRIAHETGRTSDIVVRLLTLGRVDEAVREIEDLSDIYLLGLADLFIRHGQDKAIERVMQERIKKAENVRILEWLKKYYEDRNNPTAALEQAETIFRKQPYLASYQEVRDLAGQLDRWQTLRPQLLDFLEKRHNTTILIQIALDEGDIDKALALVKSEEKPGQGYGATSFYGYGDMRLAVAKAAEETRPREAIEIYQKHVERLIAQKQRKYYHDACEYLVRVQTLYEKLGENEKWESYIAALREKNRNLRALKEELANAGL